MSAPVQVCLSREEVVPVTTPYRADHVGSLLRPPEVLEAHTAYGEGKVTLDQLRQIEDGAILTALELQQQAGLDVFTDGEYRRRAWASDFAASVDGYVDGPAPIALQWSGASVGTRPPAGRIVGERLRQRQRLTAHEVGFLKRHAPGPCKVTLPAASYVVARGYTPGVTDKVYPRRTDLLADVVAIIRAEIQALVAEGVPYIQIDNPHYPDYVDEGRRRQWRAIGLDPDQALVEDIAADNACLEGIDRDRVTVATHICRGNSRSAWHTAGGYDRIAEQVFGSLHVDRFLLEYDTERAGGFEPLRHIPPGTMVVLGLITTKQGQLESREDLVRRIEQASKYVPLAHLALSPQCGFASVAEGNRLTWDDQRRKLELVVETARKVWG
jgi:5-methyltetrahydropteroyltriglutamate--homocysteine methyltransferase